MTPVLFDLDGLLLDTERVAMNVFCEEAVSLGVSAEAAEEAFLGLIGATDAQHRASLTSILPAGTDLDAFMEACRKKRHALVDGTVPLRPYAKEVVEAVAAAGHPMAVVTSSKTDRARLKLEWAGMLDHFQTVIGADMVPATKPDPAPYLVGAAALAAAPEDCVAFEDSDTGVTSAVGAGCRVVQVPDLRPRGKPLPDLGQAVASDLREALEIAGLEKLVSQ